MMNLKQYVPTEELAEMEKYIDLIDDSHLEMDKYHRLRMLLSEAQCKQEIKQ